LSFGRKAVTQLHASVRRSVDDGTGLYCCRFTALPVLPHQHIHPMFDRLKLGVDGP